MQITCDEKALTLKATYWTQVDAENPITKVSAGVVGVILQR